jgi:NAD(P)-dependent dehydrogenase (short-subunit alcohol dehydrogenase family)
MSEQEVAVVVGVGPGLGASLAMRFAKAGMNVALAARNLERVEGIAVDCCSIDHRGRAYAVDATSEASVESLFDQVAADMGVPHVVVYNAGAFVKRGVLETTVEEFERCWRVGCLGGFLVGRAAVRRMLARIDAGGPGGTILFTGATASVRGSAQFHNLAVGKFGLRALAQSMAREFQPRGIHVAHVVIDGQIGADRPGHRPGERGPDAVLDPDAIAETYCQLHRQSRSAWTFEVDLRPWVEKF